MEKPKVHFDPILSLLVLLVMFVFTFLATMALAQECKSIAYVSAEQFNKLKEIHYIPNGETKICGDPTLKYFEACFEICVRVNK